VGLMTGQKGLILGVANDQSIAWAVAKLLHEEGAELAFTYQNEKTGQYVLPLFEQVNSRFHAIMDVTDEDSINQVMRAAGEALGGEMDFIVHSIAGGPMKGELNGRYVETSREGFLNSMLVSVYSLQAVARACLPFMQNRSASIVTMSYYGAEKVVSNYNVMGAAKAALESSVRYLAADLGRDGIRVNTLSPGTLMTRAASGIGEFGELVEYTAAHSPLGRNATFDEVAGATLFLVSPLSTGITGQTIYVDAGYSIVGIDLDRAE